MKNFILSLSTTGVRNKFYTEATVEPIVSGEHYAFPTGINIGDRTYAAYRDGVEHAEGGAIISIRYSDNDGETWSAKSTLYDGEDIRTAYPQLFIDNPGAQIDCRDPRMTKINNNMLLLAGFITVRDTYDLKIVNISFYVRYVYSGDVLNYTIDSIFYIDDVTQFATPIIHSDVVYVSTYQKYDPDWDVAIYKSIDNGVSFTRVSTVMPQTINTILYNCNEMTICMIDEKMIMRARQTTQEAVSVYCESDDYGVTWGEFSFAENNLDGLDSKYLGNGKVAFIGRRRETDNEKTMLYVVDWGTKVNVSELAIHTTNPTSPDQGYSTIQKVKDRYFITYFYPGNGTYWNVDTGIFFRQLIYNEETFSFSFTE